MILRSYPSAPQTRLSIGKCGHLTSKGRHYCVNCTPYLRAAKAVAHVTSFKHRKNAKDMMGQRFGRLVVIAAAPSIASKARWRCQCDCGGQSIHARQVLIAGEAKSCGCLKRETGPRNARAGAHKLRKHDHTPPRVRGNGPNVWDVWR